VNVYLALLTAGYIANKMRSSHGANTVKLLVCE